MALPIIVGIIVRVAPIVAGLIRNPAVRRTVAEGAKKVASKVGAISSRATQTCKQLINSKQPQLTPEQAKNFQRFMKKIPKNSWESVVIRQGKNGDVTFTATSPGRVPGSRAIYEKTVNSQGQTIGYPKTVYDPKGNVASVKRLTRNGFAITV